MTRNQEWTESPPPALMGLVEQIPKEWTQADRDRFMVAFELVLDFCIPIEEEPIP